MIENVPQRIPDQIMADFVREVQQGDVAHAHVLLNEAIADVLDTAKRAAYWKFQRQVDDVDALFTEIDDYVTMFYRGG